MSSVNEIEEYCAADILHYTGNILQNLEVGLLCLRGSGVSEGWRIEMFKQVTKHLESLRNLIPLIFIDDLRDHLGYFCVNSESSLNNIEHVTQLDLQWLAFIHFKMRRWLIPDFLSFLER